MKLSIEAMKQGMFMVRGDDGSTFYGSLGECLDYIEGRFVEDEVNRSWARAAQVRQPPVDLIRFAKSGQIGPVTESNPFATGLFAFSIPTPKWPDTIDRPPVTESNP